MVVWAVTIAPAINGMADRLADPSSLPPPPINSPRTSNMLAFAKLYQKNRNNNGTKGKLKNFTVN
jgi:hypothetical protein